MTVPISIYPFVKVINNNELLTTTTNNIAAFVDLDGKFTPKNNLILQNKPIVGMTLYGLYLVVLFENAIQV